MKTKIPNFFVLVVLFVGLVSGFLFSVQKTEDRFFLKISNRREKEPPESHLGLFRTTLP